MRSRRLVRCRRSPASVACWFSLSRSRDNALAVGEAAGYGQVMLIEGASEGRGGARPLLGVLRGADAILYCHDAGAPVADLRAVIDEVSVAGIERPALIGATKADQAEGTALRAAFPALQVVEVSVLDDESLDRLRETLSSCVPAVCTPGDVTVYRWSVYRDRLTFTPVPGRTKMTGLDVQPFTRVR